MLSGKPWPAPDTLAYATNASTNVGRPQARACPRITNLNGNLGPYGNMLTRCYTVTPGTGTHCRRTNTRVLYRPIFVLFLPARNAAMRPVTVMCFFPVALPLLSLPTLSALAPSGGGEAPCRSRLLLCSREARL